MEVPNMGDMVRITNDTLMCRDCMYRVDRMAGRCVRFPYVKPKEIFRKEPFCTEYECGPSVAVD